MNPLADFLDHFRIEGGDVGGLAAGDDAVVHHDFFVQPDAAGVLTSV